MFSRRRSPCRARARHRLQVMTVPARLEAAIASITTATKERVEALGKEPSSRQETENCVSNKLSAASAYRVTGVRNTPLHVTLKHEEGS